jgi:hypothetical protein
VYGGVPGGDAAPAYGAPAYAAPQGPGYGAPQDPAYGAPQAAAYPYPGPGVPGGPVGAAPKKGLALTSMILGIVAVVLCLVPFIINLAFVIALAGLVVGIIALVQIGKGKQQGKGMGIAGIIMAVVAIVGVIVSQIFYTAVLDEVSDALDDASQQIEQEVDQPADDTAADDPAADDAADDAAVVDDMTIGFDEIFLYEDGLEITVGAPQPYTPGEYAVGLEGGPSYIVMNVTIVNGSTENYDPILFYSTASSAGTEATEIYDSVTLDSRPSTAVLPGASISFPLAYAVADPAQLVIEIEPSMFVYESLVVTNG